MNHADVGENIRTIRKRRGLNQDELAELARLNRVTIAKYESGKVEPGAQALSRLADVLDVTVDDLLGRDGEKEEAPVTELLDEKLIDLLITLSPEQVQRVMDFVAGLKASEAV